MISTKSEDWSEVSEEMKRQNWRVYCVFNVLRSDFNADDYGMQDSQEEVEVDGGYQWVYKWDNPSQAPESAENGVLLFPIFTKEMKNEDYYDMGFRSEEPFYEVDDYEDDS